MDQITDLRPRTVGEILDASFVLYRKRFGALLLASTVLSIPTLVAAVLLSEGAGEALGGYLSAGVRYVEASGSSGGRVSPAVTKALSTMMDQARDVQVYTLISAGFQALSRAGACLAGALIAFAAVQRRPTPTGWAMVRGSLPKLVAATGIQVAAALVGAMCAICFPIPIFVGTLVAPVCALMIAETGPQQAAVARWGFAPLRWAVLPFACAIDAIGRTFTLSMHGMTLLRGTFLMSVVLFFVSAIVSVLSLAAGFVASSMGVWYVANHYAEVLFLPVIGIAFALWYVDLRVRREGLDLTEQA